MESKIHAAINNLNTPNTEDPTPRFILPFSGAITTRISQFLRNKTGFDFGYTPGRKSSQFLSTHKDKLPPCPKGVYRIPCGTCPATYIGQTKRDLKTRLKEHARDIRNKKDSSAVSQHIVKNPSHQIDFDNAYIFHPEPKGYDRKFMEGLFINAEKFAMNANDGMQINSIWSSSLLPLLQSN